MSTISIPYDWVKTLPVERAALEAIPRRGYLSPFPWKQLVSQIADHFEIEGLAIEQGDFIWRNSEELFEGLASPQLLLSGTLSPLEGEWGWIMSEADWSILMSLLLTEGGQAAEVTSPDFRQGFCQFVALEILPLLNIDKSLAPRLHRETKKENITGTAFCLDCTLRLYGHSIVGRFFFSQQLYQAIREHYNQRKVQFTLPSALAASLELLLQVEVGRTTLPLNEWSQVSLGDFLLLDKCSLKGYGGTKERQSARAMLTLNGTPLFRCKLKQGAVKILGTPDYYEVEGAMAQKGGKEEELDFEFEGDEHEEFLDGEEGLLEEEIEDNLHEESLAEESDEEEELEYSEEEKVAASSSRQPPPSVEKAELPPVAAAKSAPLQNLPLTVIVEVGRLQMTLQKLTELQPGHVLELDLLPENGVDLVVNNKIVGKGELIRLGEALGVRILDLGG